MKKIFLSGLVFFCITCFSHAQNKLKGICILKINLSGPLKKTDKIYLSYQLPSMLVIKETLIAKGGVINFSKKLDEPLLAMLSTRAEDDINYLDDYRLNEGIFSFFMQPGNLIITTGRKFKSSIISNTVLQKEYLTIKAHEQTSSEKIMVIGKEENQLIRNHDTTAAILKLNGIEKIKESMVGYYKSCIVSNKFHSMITVYALEKYFSYGRDLYDPTSNNRTNTADSLYSLLAPIYKQSATASALKKQINTLINIETGKIAPDFNANDTSGRKIVLSSLRGKFVLIDFWASWCGACRAQFPYLKKIYKEFSNKNFEIFGVALDEKNRWKNAVKEDNTSWLQVLNNDQIERSPAMLYHISPIPMNYLIDPNGKIIANNLSPEQLKQKLTELIGK